MFSRFKSIFITLTLTATLSIFTTGALAAQKIKFASVNWTGVTIKTELAISILESLGYKAENKILSVPILYSALSTGDIDIFLGNWMPSMASVANKFFKDGSVIQYVANMPDAKYTLATPTFCAKKGLKDFKDIVKFGDELEWKIYGIEAGNDGNIVISNMIKKNLFGLGKFEMVPSSEFAMLTQVQSFAREKHCIVFLGWAPHRMNERIDMTYLTGSTADTFGPNNGTATVWTNTRKGFAEDQPNIAKLLKNMVFPIPMMNQIMTALSEHKELTPRLVGLKWVKAHPETYQNWLEGVTTADGEPAVPAFEAYLAKMK